jgi:NADH-quinone oxidoreductase subunit N
MGFGAGHVEMGSSIVFYALAYTVGTVGAFGALAYIGRRGSEVETYDDLNGLGFKYPWLGAALAVFMLSSAGIPPAAGFMAKFLVFKAAIDASVIGSAADVSGAGGLMVLAVLGIVTSVAGVYYYLKVIVHLYMKQARREMHELPNSGAKLAIVFCAIATLWIGMFPGKYVDHADRAMDQMNARPDGVYVQPSDLAD